MDFSLKHSLFFFVLLHIHLEGRFVKFSTPFNSKTSQLFDSWTTVMFPNVSPSSSKMHEASTPWALADARSVLPQYQVSSPPPSDHVSN